MLHPRPRGDHVLSYTWTWPPTGRRAARPRRPPWAPISKPACGRDRCRSSGSLYTSPCPIDCLLGTKPIHSYYAAPAERPFTSCRASWPSSGGARKIRLSRERTSENQVFSELLREWRTHVWATLQNHEQLYCGHIYHGFSEIQLPMKEI